MFFAVAVTKEWLHGSCDQTIIVPFDGKIIRNAICNDKFAERMIGLLYGALMF